MWTGEKGSESAALRQFASRFHQNYITLHHLARRHLVEIQPQNLAALGMLRGETHCFTANVSSTVETFGVNALSPYYPLMLQ